MAKCLISQGYGRSSATAMSPALAKRLPKRGMSFRPIARTTSKRWRMRRSPSQSRCAGNARWSARRRSVRAQPIWSPRRRSPTSTGCRCCSFPATSMPAAGPTRCCSRSKTFRDGTVSANDCFRPVSRYFDRITRPEQLLDALPRAVATMIDPATCGPATLAFCQDVQAEAFDYPESFFERRVWRIRRSEADREALRDLVNLIKGSTAPLIIAGGGVHYAGAADILAKFASEHGIPVAETQAGKGALPWDHPLALGSIGVTGTSAANALAADADLVIGIGTRFQDFTTGSWALFANPRRKIAQVNISSHDAHKRGSLAVVGDARLTLEALQREIGDWRAPEDWSDRVAPAIAEWNAGWDEATAAGGNALPSDAQVIGAVWRTAPGRRDRRRRGRRPSRRAAQALAHAPQRRLPSRIWLFLHGLRDRRRPRREAGRAGTRGHRHARRRQLPDAELRARDLGDDGRETDRRAARQSRLRLHQPAAASDRRRQLQQPASRAAPDIDFVAHARSLGADAEKAANIAELEQAMERALRSDRSYVIVIDTDPEASTEAGGAWWDVAVPEVSERAQVQGGAQGLRPTGSKGAAVSISLRGEPDRLDQRRHAGAGRRHAGRNRARGRARHRLCRHRAGRQIPARSGRAEGFARLL